MDNGPRRITVHLELPRLDSPGRKTTLYSVLSTAYGRGGGYRRRLLARGALPLAAGQGTTEEALAGVVSALTAIIDRLD